MKITFSSRSKITIDDDQTATLVSDRLVSGYQDLVTADGQLGQDGIRDDLTNLNPDVWWCRM